MNKGLRLYGTLRDAIPVMAGIRNNPFMNKWLRLSIGFGAVAADSKWTRFDTFNGQPPLVAASTARQTGGKWRSTATEPLISWVRCSLAVGPSQVGPRQESARSGGGTSLGRRMKCIEYHSIFNELKKVLPSGFGGACPVDEAASRVVRDRSLGVCRGVPAAVATEMRFSTAPRSVQRQDHPPVPEGDAGAPA